MATPLVRAPRIDRRRACYRLSIRRSRIHRYGVFALEDIPVGRKVIEYTGERCNRAETKRRSDGLHTYLFAVDDYWSLDGAVGGSGAEIVNHACDPNLRCRIEGGRVSYVSRRGIRAGEELTIDYKFDRDTGTDHCKCRGPNCRGTIQEGGSESRPPAKRRYRRKVR